MKPRSQIKARKEVKLKVSRKQCGVYVEKGLE